MRHIILAATALVMLGGSAFAESASGNGTSNSAARATANTMSAAKSAAVGNVGNSSTTTVNVSGAGSSNTGSSTTDPSGYTGQYIGYGGGYTVRNTPEVIPPNVVGGNPCSVGASGGMSVAGFGIAGGATWADKQCERRQQAALLFNIGKPKAATELMCQDDNVRAALRIAGEPCAADAPRVAAAEATPAPAVSPATASVAVVTLAPAAKPIRPEWCYTTGPAELRHHAECQVGS
jgi:hypothetical protein